jgi:hypothetical protein
MGQIYRAKGLDFGSTQKPMIAIAAYEGLSAGCVQSLYMAASALMWARMDNELIIYAENCSVNDARNEMTAEFLASDCTDLVFLDADVRFTADALLTLLSYDRAVVAGAYPKKNDANPGYPVQLFQGELWTEEDGLLEVMGVPTGFLRIRRGALETLCRYVQHVRPIDERLGRIPIIFERTTINSYRMTGDFEFCRKWRSLDGKIFVDPELEFGHTGKKEWQGSLGKHLRHINGIEDDA